MLRREFASNGNFDKKRWLSPSISYMYNISFRSTQENMPIMIITPPCSKRALNRFVPFMQSFHVRPRTVHLIIYWPIETKVVYAYPELFFGALPPPLPFFSGAPPCPPTSGLFGSLISLLPGLTFRLFFFPPASCSADASASSGDVFEESKAALVCAAPSSEPDLAYSVDRGLSESLSCASFCANRVGVVETKRELRV